MVKPIDRLELGNVRDRELHTELDHVLQRAENFCIQRFRGITNAIELAPFYEPDGDIRAPLRRYLRFCLTEGQWAIRYDVWRGSEQVSSCDVFDADERTRVEGASRMPRLIDALISASVDRANNAELVIETLSGYLNRLGAP